MTGFTADQVPAETLTLEQQASLTSGADMWHTTAIPAAGVPGIMVTDGPHGLRKQPEGGDPWALGTSLPATCFPTAVGLGSSWDPALVERVGAALGTEARAARVSVLLGPGLNVKRSPLCGRNFEYFSEDPLVTGRLGTAFVKGVQAQGVGACPKHFAANNQETDRLRVSADVDERTLREIYLPAFEQVVTQARPWTVMCSYNRINSVYASQNRWLLTDVLRDEWGFDGLVVSDWGAVNDRAAALAAGLDLEMPPTGTDPTVVDAVTAGELDPRHVETAAANLLRLLERTSPALDETPAADLDAHHQLARETAAAAAVLLKNEDDILPLHPAGQRVALIGEFARSPRYQGAGSSQVVPTRLDDALTALQSVLPEGSLQFAPGYTLDGIADPDLVTEAATAARRADLAIVFLGLPPSAESEGFDRTTIELPEDQIALLHAVHDANPDVVVVLSNGAAVSTARWNRNAKAILEAWLPGQAGGTAIADLLTGTANPSGKLTETIPERLEDTPSHLSFPGGEGHVRYAEGIFVGYRHHDTLHGHVDYPFGFGLSYTTFAITDATVHVTGDTRVEVTFTVTNTGTRTGSEVVQIYVADLETSVERPSHELKDFTKVTLEPGQSTTVSRHLGTRAFAYWSLSRSRWRVEPGDFDIEIGTSSRHILARHRITLAGDNHDDPLTDMSTLAEWFAHPTGGPRLRNLLATANVTLWDSPDMTAMLNDLPLAKAAAFGGSPTREELANLVQQTFGTAPAR